MVPDNNYNGLELAIIGMSGLFVESRDHRMYWEHLKNGKELIHAYSNEQLRESGVPEKILQDDRYVRSVGIVDNKDLFDHPFFGYSTVEAQLMNPQTRLLHELCWKALDDAGYSSFIDKEKIGLFAGASADDNWKIHAYKNASNAGIDPFYLNILADKNFISTLVAYKLNLRGPAIYLDTACSTSLVAVHLACRSLLTRECRIALAGAVSVKSVRRKGYLYQEGMVSSKDGHCRTFDADASGTASGEGGGVVVLKRLTEAISDRDHIYAVIRSTASNNDGNLKVGYAAPGIKGQAECILAARKLAGIPAESIGYIEAHGTATRLGDAVEISALNEAFGGDGKNKYCAIGSVKSNIGHLDVAAGIAGLIKTALSLQYRQIPASLHFKTPNPEIDFAAGPFYVNTLLKKWQPNGDFPLRAGISSFGIGGTNVHGILEEAPVPATMDPGREYHLLTVSAKTEAALIRYLDGLRDFLKGNPDINPADMAFSLQVGRKHFSYRKSLVYKKISELLPWLDRDNVKEGVSRSMERDRALVFMFPGQGTQYMTMGADLFKTEPVFRSIMEKGFSVIENLTGTRYDGILYGEAADRDRINETKYTQPLLFLVEYALANLLISFGITPQYMIGHSIGEYVAACVSGVFSFEDALRIIIKRAELMNGLEQGAMLSVPISPEEAGHLLAGKGIYLSAINSPEQIVLSGDLKSADLLAEKLNNLHIPFTRLRTSHAFHSGMLDDILEQFRREWDHVTLKPLRIPFISNLTGEFIREEEALSPEYWVSHMRETVRFSKGVKTLLAASPSAAYIEVGAGNSLANFVRQQMPGAQPPFINIMRSYKETGSDMACLLKGMGILWANGYDMNWESYYKGERRARVPLPSYSFEPLSHAAAVDPFDNGLLTGMNLVNHEKTFVRVYYPSWKRSILNPVDKKDKNRIFLFLTSGNAWLESLRQELLTGNNRIVEILSGGAYEKISKDKFVMDPCQAIHFTRLADDLKKDDVLFTDMIYAWGMDAGPDLELNERNEAFNIAYLGLVRILQSVRKNDHFTRQNIIILTDGLHIVTGDEKGSVTQSLLLGLMNVLPQEYPLTGMNIDVDRKDNGGSTRLLAREILCNAGTGDRIIAHRNGHRWIIDYQPDTISLEKGDSLIKKEATVLITGGLGNLGFTLAKYLLHSYQAKIILIGRKKMAEQKNGDDPNADEWSRRLGYLQTISNNVQYIQADVSDRGQLEEAVVRIENIWGPVQGVIHTAGILDPASFQFIQDIDTEKSVAMFAPKVKGIQNIYDVFKTRMPEFVWISSSLSCILGGLGFSAYASANLFMDHFVLSKAGELPAWRCMDLTGLSYKSDETSRDEISLNIPELIQLFEWSLSVNKNAVALGMKDDLSVRMEKAYRIRNDSVSGVTKQEVATDRQERPGLLSAYSAPETETESVLKDIFEDFFSVEPIGIDDDFFQLGGDSLKGMMLLKRIRKRFDVKFPLHEFFQKATIRALASKLDEMSDVASAFELKNEITI